MINFEKLMVILLIVSTVGTGSLATETVFAKKGLSEDSQVQTVQTTSDNGQGIPKKIADLQSQIDELKQQIQNFKDNPPIKLQATARFGGFVNIDPNRGANAFADCKKDEVPVGGGFTGGDVKQFIGMSTPGSTPASIVNHDWHVTGFNTYSQFLTISASVICLKLVPAQ